MSEPVTFNVLGPPQGKGRARAFVRGGRVGHYTPQKTRSYESLIFGAAVDAMGSRAPFGEAVELTLRAIYPIPASWSEKKRQRAIVGELKPTKKPDLDNVAKVFNDAMNGVVYVDDSQVILIHLEKRYGPQPLVVCTVKPIFSADCTENQTPNLGVSSQVETKMEAGE
ncbi:MULTISPECIES: RusA family crossover junction endodeoxyribonuclease [Bradyrhizobium]|uniref:RusA family crossover junction endodeoxyribonuclease n=1 Tax=Bradyrhizobium TaxID=374 RepID=UPI0020A0C858|nr:RusA family crossover junction endodeoxyribonuclease [Bradyrhizobium elkanii]MCP1969916.1 Holliday junction resolvase RusA-like endonuclease [Bradyrhizobium elkanii]MCS4108576.1 Holliday junction resolvase RusA-like endonuclease [Bradyrhizobium elkanii]